MQDGSMQGMGAGSVYVQTNEAVANRVIAFSRAADGGTGGTGDFPFTGAAGDGVPHLTSQGSLALHRRRASSARHERGLPTI